MYMTLHGSLDYICRSYLNLKVRLDEQHLEGNVWQAMPNNLSINLEIMPCNDKYLLNGGKIYSNWSAAFGKTFSYKYTALGCVTRT